MGNAAGVLGRGSLLGSSLDVSTITQHLETKIHAAILAQVSKELEPKRSTPPLQKIVLPRSMVHGPFAYACLLARASHSVGT